VSQIEDCVQAMRNLSFGSRELAHINEILAEPD
jgi:hypothetical protein